MFKDEYQSVCNAAKGKLGLLEKSPLGYFVSSIVAGIVSGYSDNLLLRAADVTIKEARPLILVPRESPLSPIHLRNLQELSAMGVRIVPPMISFYQNYTTIEEWTNNFVERLLEVVGLKNEMKSWSGM